MTTGPYFALHVAGDGPVTAETVTMADGHHVVHVVLGALILTLPTPLADELADAIIGAGVDDPVPLRPVVDINGVY